MKKSKLFLVHMFILAIMLGVTAGAAWAKDIVLQLEPNDDPNIAGYRVYYKAGTPTGPFDGTGAAEGPSPIDIGRSLTATVSSLEGLHYIGVTAYDFEGNESELSNVVASHYVPVASFPGNFASVSPAQVDFAWETPPAIDEIVSYKLVYGTDPTALPASLAAHQTQGSVLLAGISFLGLAALWMNPRRRMRRFIPLVVACSLFLVSGCGGGGGGSRDSASGDTAQAQVVTDIVTTSHTLYDLQPATTYYWQVVAVDAEGYEQGSEVYSFTTEAI